MNVHRFEKWLNLRLVQVALRILIAVLITLILSQFKLDMLESTLFDWGLRLSSRPDPSGKIVLVAIDQQSIDALGGEPKAKDYLELVKQLKEAAPRYLVTLNNPVLVTGPMNELKQFARQATEAHLIYANNDLPDTGQDGFPALASPFSQIPVKAAPLTADRSIFARDGVSRRIILKYDRRWTFPAEMANSYNGITDIHKYKGVFPFLDSRQAYIQYRKIGAFPKVSFIDIERGQFDPGLLKDKIVLIGTTAHESTQAYMKSPFSNHSFDISQLELQAEGIDTLLTNQAPQLTAPWMKYLFTFIVSILTASIVLSLRPLEGLIALVVLVTAFLGTALLITDLFNWLFPVAHPLAAVFVAYYFVIPYRLIIENKKSWEYLQKNQLLTQVEELKSNFLRLMSHDLKTPLARIQGMADIIKQEEQLLSVRQKRAVQTIAESGDELNDFIRSILDLSRIESKDIKLHRKSKDINQLLNTVIHQCRYSAKRKNIQIVTEFEPMFSVKIDEDLMKQVFSNLVENAIKYSPENSKVLITTEESNGRIHIQVADQGIGIHEADLPHIFDKFYRASEAKTEFHGTGLGLYLAKYFVELHDGRIDVESEPRKGSTFSVVLPMEDATLKEGGTHV